jgi:tetratricopeptide (TPR) repeat protein
VGRILKTLLLALLAESVLGFGQQPALESVLANAQSAQVAGDYASAARAYQEAVKIRPGTPELWANLGLMQQETGDISAAMQSFLQANHLNPSLYVPNLFLGIDYAHTGKAKEAIPLLEKAEQLNKVDPQAPLALGRAYIAARKYSAAAKELDRAIHLDPKLGAAWFTLGIARLDEVEEEARLMSEENKESPFAGALYAESLAKQSRYGEAASLYKTLLDANPQPPCLRSELGFALLREHDAQGAVSAFADERATHPECGLALLGQARLAIENGDAARATETLRQLWNRDRGFFEANASILAEGLSGEKIEEDASLIAGGSAQLPPDLRDALLAAFNASSNADAVAQKDSATVVAPGHRTAEEEYAAGKFRQCALGLESINVAGHAAAGHAPLAASQLQLLATCAFFTGDNERASAAADALRAREPRSIEALYWSIQANEHLAFVSLARFQELEPDSARSHVLMGDIYNQLERYDTAQAEYLKALAIAPSDPAAMLGLATVYLNNRNTKAGMQIAEAALIRSPEDPELNLLMAQGLISEREYAEAEPYLQKSLHAKPQMLPRIHVLIGKAYAETGRTQEAIEQLKLGASSDEDGSVQYLLVQLYRRAGDTKDAHEALDRMKAIKEQRDARGFKRIEDPDLSPIEPGLAEASTP